MAKEGNVSSRIETIRLRTWTLTLAIIVALVFYLLVNVGQKEFDYISFIIMTVLQILAQSLYFPEGELFGEKNSVYLANKLSYNTKANEINGNGLFGKLREYCDYEFEERKERYIKTELSKIEIASTEYEQFKEMSKRQIKKLKHYEVQLGEGKSKLITLSAYKKKVLLKLLFGKCPVQPNHPETIMSAVESDGLSAIRDGSVKYKSKAYILKMLKAVLIGGGLGFIGYKLKDGLGFAEIVQITTYFASLFSTAVLSYSGGETCTVTYKNRFYVQLSNFLDCFAEWGKISFDKQ